MCVVGSDSDPRGRRPSSGPRQEAASADRVPPCCRAAAQHRRQPGSARAPLLSSHLCPAVLSSRGAAHVRRACSELAPAVEPVAPVGAILSLAPAPAPAPTEGWREAPDVLPPVCSDGRNPGCQGVCWPSLQHGADVPSFADACCWQSAVTHHHDPPRILGAHRIRTPLCRSLPRNLNPDEIRRDQGL